MLKEEEVKAFLAMLLAFQRSTGASGRNLTALFNVSAVTMARWLRAARGEEGEVVRMYYCRTEPLARAIDKMNRHAARHGTFEKVSRITEPAKKLDALRALMAAAVK